VSTPPKKQPIPFGKYLLLDRINIGGMAEVWRGKQFGASGFERLVAIKRILPNIAEDEEFISMFIDEAKISVQLTHANIAQIYDLGQIQSSYFIAMEYIPGKDMRAIFERCRKNREPAPIPLICYVTSKLCEGLDYAHRKKDGMGRDMNIVHRDISPQNVLISYEGEVKVIDFGIAKAAGKATKTQAGILKGKFGYMSPEQIRGLPLDRRSDIFAIGVCLYEMLTGERLFVGDSDFSVLEKVRKADVLPPSTYNRRIPESLEQIVLRALAKDVDERYQYASELADDLQRFIITPESVFGRKDLMQYMKSTFAEDVEREKVRIQEYADIVPPPEMMVEPSNRPQSGVSPRASQMLPQSALPPSPSSRASQALPQGALPPQGAPASRLSQALPQSAIPQSASGAPPVRKPMSSSGLPKLTAAPAQASLDDERATIIAVEGEASENLLASGMPRLTAAPAKPSMDDERATMLASELQDLKPGDSLDARAKAPRSNVPPPEPRSLRASPPRVAPGLSREVLEPTPLLTEPPTTPGMHRSPASRPVSDAPVAPPMLVPARAPQGASGNGQGQGPGNALDSASEAGPAPRLRIRVNTELPEDATEFPTDSGLEPRRLNVGVLLLVGVLLVGLLSTGLYVLLFRAPAKGLIVVSVSPPELRAKAHLFVNREDHGIPTQWPAFLDAPTGPAVVTVSVEGYEPFTRTVEVKEVKPNVQPATVQVDVPSKAQHVALVVATAPEDAEIRIDDKTARKEGVRELFLGELSSGMAHKVEVRRLGFKPSIQEVTPERAEPVKLRFDLEALSPVSFNVVSNPPGAIVSANGKALGTTPVQLKLTGEVQTLTLTKKCFEPTSLTVRYPATPGGPAQELRGDLRRQLNCP